MDGSILLAREREKKRESIYTRAYVPFVCFLFSFPWNELSTAPCREIHTHQLHPACHVAVGTWTAFIGGFVRFLLRWFNAIGWKSTPLHVPMWKGLPPLDECNIIFCTTGCIGNSLVIHWNILHRFNQSVSTDFNDYGSCAASTSYRWPSPPWKCISKVVQ